MKLMLTPEGRNDSVVERIPKVVGLVPRKDHVIVLLCNDGLDTASCKTMTPLQLANFRRLLTKLCQLNNDSVKSVAVITISFFEPGSSFHEKVKNADLFFMANFTHNVDHVEGIFRRHDAIMRMKRMAVANKVVTNTMSLWAVGGAAMACGAFWRNSRRMPVCSHQMLAILADGYVDYTTGFGGNVPLTNALRSFQISGGTGLVIVTTDTIQHAEAFRCANTGTKGKKWIYHNNAARITAKLQLQIQRLRSMVSLYHDGHGNLWSLHWGTGHVAWNRCHA